MRLKKYYLVNHYSVYLFGIFFYFQKLTVFLFEDILVLTRPATRGDRMTYQVYRQPIPADQLVFEDCVDGEVKMGSFRGALMGQAQPGKMKC